MSVLALLCQCLLSLMISEFTHNHLRRTHSYTSQNIVLLFNKYKRICSDTNPQAAPITASADQVGGATVTHTHTGWQVYKHEMIVLQITIVGWTLTCDSVQWKALNVTDLRWKRQKIMFFFSVPVLFSSTTKHS